MAILTSAEEFWEGPSSDIGQDVDEAFHLYATSPLPLRSRCHKFRVGSGSAWIKRDDELTCATSGSKVRKYASLIPALHRAGCSDAIVVGGCASNNVLAAAQLLTQAGIRCHLLLRAPERSTRTVLLYLNLIYELVPTEDVHFVAREDWLGHYQAEALELVADLDADGRTALIIPEGGSRREALAGALTLGIDLDINQREIGKPFTDIFMEAGTGMTVVGLVLGCQKPWMRSVTMHIACHEQRLLEVEQTYLKWCGAAPISPRIKFYPDVQFDAHDRILASRKAGILFDPIYSAKSLFLLTRLAIENSVGNDPLLVHTGAVGSFAAAAAVGSEPG